MGIKIELAYNLLPNEIENFLLNGKQVDPQLVEKRLKYFVLYGKNKEIEIHYGNEARKISLALQPDIDGSQRTLKGNVACQGKVIGTAKIVFSKDDFQKINEGDILVTPETTPDFVQILHKIKAIVTDEGGISCHAAIISREMNIPCVVGTSHGTKIIKDGDKIEVNALKGIVNKLD